MIAIQCTGIHELAKLAIWAREILIEGFYSYTKMERDQGSLDQESIVDVNDKKESRIRKIIDRMSNELSKEAIELALMFEPRTTDVLIVGYPKSGTTWVQQIVHQLRTGGDEDFKDIHHVVPGLSAARDICIDVEVDQKYFPRCFKALAWSSPKDKGKYIVVLRNPYSVAYSDYKYHGNWLYQSGEVSSEEYVLEYWISNSSHVNPKLKSYFYHVVNWCAHRQNSNVLFVFYEDLVEDLNSGVRRIAKFMDINNEANICSALERSSFEYMKEKWDKFNSNDLKRARNEALGLEETAGMNRNKIRSGSTTEGKENLTERVLKALDSKWKEIIEPVTGYACYEELHKGLIDSLQH